MTLSVPSTCWVCPSSWPEEQRKWIQAPLPNFQASPNSVCPLRPFPLCFPCWLGAFPTAFLPPEVGTTASTGRESSYPRKFQLWHPGAQSSKDATMMLLMFPTQVPSRRGRWRGCWCWGVTLGDREIARTDPFSLSELNASRARGSNHSVNSLPGPAATCGSTHGSVVSWAESFETLLQDRVAVTYFTVSVTAQSSAPAPVHCWTPTVPQPQCHQTSRSLCPAGVPQEGVQC